MKFKLQRVQYMPGKLEPGILYVSYEFDIAIHLCACGCGCKVKTPLGPTEWSVTETKTGPTLRPSIGNWQHECQSHYLIDHGNVIWAKKWTTEEINAGRCREEEQRREYYDTRCQGGLLQRLWQALKRLPRR